jgi:hypothetical protein
MCRFSVCRSFFGEQRPLPEERLLTAIITRAWRDINGRYVADEIKIEARDWVRSNRNGSNDSELTFVKVCSLLGLDVEKMRTAMLRADK